MSKGINHAKHQHRGRQTERFEPKAEKVFHPNQLVKAANKGRKLSPDEVAAMAAKMGLPIAKADSPRLALAKLSNRVSPSLPPLDDELPVSLQPVVTGRKNE